LEESVKILLLSILSYQKKYFQEELEQNKLILNQEIIDFEKQFLLKD